jgi:transcriptional regulator GlxA family with amidase domain
MDVAIVLYPGFTALDAVGPYTVLAFAPGWTVTFVAAARGPVLDDRGFLSLTATATFDEDLHPDVIVVPGGVGAQAALGDRQLLDWLRATHRTATWTTSVCVGSLLLGAAGLLDGKPATSHWGWRDVLGSLGAKPVEQRVVICGDTITAAGVSSGIDMALTLLAEAAGEQTAKAVQLAIEYAPDPPFDSETPPTRSPVVLLPATRSPARD